MAWLKLTVCSDMLFAPILADIDRGSLRSMRDPWGDGGMLMGIEKVSMCFTHTQHLQKGVWPLQVATVQYAPYFDSVQAVFYCSQIISGALTTANCRHFKGIPVQLEPSLQNKF